MQKLSSIHKFSLKIMHISGSHELKGHTYQNIIQKFSLFQLFPLEIHCNQSCNQLTPAILGHSHQKYYQSLFNFFELLPTCKKPGYFINLFRMFLSFKNTAIRLAESILAFISGTILLPNIDYVQKHSN